MSAISILGRPGSPGTSIAAGLEFGIASGPTSTAEREKKRSSPRPWRSPSGVRMLPRLRLSPLRVADFGAEQPGPAYRSRQHRLLRNHLLLLARRHGGLAAGWSLATRCERHRTDHGKCQEDKPPTALARSRHHGVPPGVNRFQGQATATRAARPNPCPRSAGRGRGCRRARPDRPVHRVPGYPVPHCAATAETTPPAR